MELKPIMWAGGALWLAVVLVNEWLFVRFPEGSDFGHFLSIAVVIATVAFGVALGWKGAWRLVVASVAVATISGTICAVVSYHTDPDPAAGERVLLVQTILALIIYFAVLTGLGAAGGAVYRRMRRSTAMREGT